MEEGDCPTVPLVTAWESSDGESRKRASPRPGDRGTFWMGGWNIRNGRNGGLEAAARGMDQMGCGLCVLLETHIAKGIYT